MNRSMIPITLLVTLIFMGCGSNPEPFTIDGDSVTEGSYTARALNGHELTSDYPLVLQPGLSQPLSFKLSLNGQDNEAGFGVNHELIIPAGVTEFFAPTLKFGRFAPTSQRAVSPITEATNVYFRVDLRSVLTAFGQAGRFITATHDTLAAADFNGLYLAGGTPPLSWIWDDADQSEALQFHDADGDSIYELKVHFSPPPLGKRDRTWTLHTDLDQLPQFSSPAAPLLEALTNLALEEALTNIRPDSSFAAGKAWPGVWMRDISYAAQLSLAYFFPENVKHSLRAKLNPTGRIIQDTGTGGSWPISSDRHIWTLAAWEVYLATGDRDWLAEIREPVLKALQEDLLWNRDPVSGMLLGETSFEDWRKQTYPNWMSAADIHSSQALSTNIIFKRALEIGLGLAEQNQTISRSWPQLITRLDQNIPGHFWNPRTGTPTAYVITAPAYQPAPQRDLLGESLGILFCRSFAAIDSMLVASYPRTPYGSPVISDQLPHSPTYHNQACWPFVEAYALLAARQAGNQAAFLHSFNSLIRSSALFLSHRENFQYATGRPDETVLNSEGQLWSIAGWLGAIIKGLFGISVHYDFSADQFELLLQPDNPFPWQGYTLSQLTLHNTMLNIRLQGRGSHISRMVINDQEWKADQPIPLTGGSLNILVILTTGDQTDPGTINNTKHTQPVIPRSSWSADTLHWQANSAAVLLELNGNLLDTLQHSPQLIADSLVGFFSLRSFDSSGAVSFPSQPHYQGPAATLVLNSKAPYFIELGQEVAFIRMSFSLPAAGNYLLRFVYSNGTGPVSTGNTCGLADLKINDWWLEQMVSFPHTGSWESWQTTSWYQARFEQGTNTLTLDQEALPVTNMDGKTNLFRVQTIEVIPLPE